MKKILAGIIAVIMVMTSFPAAIFAEEAAVDNAQAEVVEITTGDYEGTEYYNAVKLLSALGILEGKENGDFAPNDTLTRSEMSAVAVRFLGMDALSTGIPTAGYVDVQNDYWGKPYIDMATAMGLVNGNGDETFTPESPVTAEEAIKILVCALGYEAKAEDKGGYPAGYLNVANQLEINKGVSFPEGYSNPLPRWKLAILTYNALKADIMEKKVYGDEGFFAVSEEISALNEYHKVEKKTGIVEATYVTSFEDKRLDPGEVIVDGVQYTTELDLDSYLGYNIEFYCTMDPDLSEQEIIAFIVKTEDSDRVEIAFDDVVAVEVTSNFDVNISYYQNKGAREKRVSAKNPVVMYNGKAEEFETAAEIQAFLDANCNQGRFIYVKESKSARNVLFIENYDAYVVNMVNAETEQIMYNIYDGGSVDTDIMDLSTDEAPDRKVFIYNENGDEISVADLAANDVIMVYVSSDADLYKIYQSKAQITGKISQRDTIESSGSEDLAWSTPEPRPTPFWETVLETNMDGFTTTSSTGVPMAYQGKTFYSNKQINGEKVHLNVQANTGGVGGYYYPGAGTGFVSPSAWGLEDGAPDIMGENVLLAARDNMALGGWASPGSGPLLQSVYAGTDLKVGDQVKITAWVRGNKVINEFNKNGDTGTLQELPADQQNTTPFGVRMWLGRVPLYDDPSDLVEINGNGYKEGGWPTLVTTMYANEWTELSLEYTLTDEFLKSSTLFIDNRPDNYEGEPYPQRLFLAGIRVAKYVNPDEGYLAPRPEVPVDSSVYDVYVDGTKYETVSNFPSGLLKLGEEVTLYLDSFGKVVGYTSTTSLKNYALLVNAGLVGGAFQDTLKLKMIGTDRVLREYETLPEIEAFDGLRVRKIPVAELITNQPADPFNTHYIWSTNNADNFECVPRSWLTEKNKSDAASRKIVYFETNKDGKIDKLLVPMPEDHPDAKITMVKDFGYNEADSVLQSFWPKWITHADFTVPRNENQYRYLSTATAFMAWAEDYDDDDYSLCTDWRYTDNMGNGGRRWDYAQLYRYPGSDTVDFFVFNGESVTLYNKNFRTDNINVLVKEVVQTEDGFKINGYDITSYKVSHNISFTIKEDTRLFRDVWTYQNGEEVTWDTLPNHVGEIPVKIDDYEMPYIDENTFKKGDILKVIMTNGVATYVGMLRDAEDKIPAMTNAITPKSGTSAYDDGGITYGEITDINYRTGTMKIKGYYWTQYTGTNKDNQITEMTFDFFPHTVLRYWDAELEEYHVASFREAEVGDKFFAIDNLQYPHTGCMLIKE